MRWLGTDWIDAIKRWTIAVDIGGKDPEQILLSFSQALHCKVGALAEAGNDNPFVVPDIPPLHNIVSHLGATIKLRRRPVELAGVACDQ